MRRLLPWLVLAGCTDEPAQLQLVDLQYAGHSGLAGVESDGAGGFYLAFNDESIDYYAYDTTRIVHSDAALEVDYTRFTIADTFTAVSGLALGDGALWVNHSGSFADDNRIRKVDPATGHELASFATEPDIVDLAARDQMLLLSNMFNEIVALDITDGGELWRTNLPFLPEGGTLRGIATNADGIWVLAQETDLVYVLDDRGTVKRTYSLPGRQDTYADKTDQLAWDGDRLVIAHDNDLAFFTVPR